MKRIKILKKILQYIALVIGALIMILPFVWMTSTAFKLSNAVFIMPPQFIPDEPTFDNFIEVVNAFPLLKFTWNSIFVAVLSTFGLLVVSSMAGFAFGRIDFKGKEILFMLYLGTMMVPSQVTLTPLFIIMRNIGWSDTYQALVFPGMISAFNVFLIRQFVEGVPKSLDEAVYIDGGGKWIIYTKISLPLIKPALATAGILGFMNSWNSFLWPLIIVSNEDKMTLPLGLSMLQGRWTTDWNVLMAGTLISVIPIILVYVFAQQYIIKGMSHTGIK